MTVFYNMKFNKLLLCRFIQCNWNGTWTKYTSLDECVWIECLYPKQVINFIGHFFHQESGEGTGY